MTETQDSDTGDDEGGTPAEAKPKDGEGLSDALTRDLTAHRTLALRFALGEQPDAALVAVTHALAAQSFYRGAEASCLELRATSTSLMANANGIEDGTTATLLAARHPAWVCAIPADAADLWGFVAALDPQKRMELFAHCASLTVNAIKLSPSTRQQALATADRLTESVGLDMADHWSPAGQSYLERVTKGQILAAVREGASDKEADRIAGLKKPQMAEAAAELLEGRRWLPSLLKAAAPAESVTAD